METARARRWGAWPACVVAVALAIVMLLASCSSPGSSARGTSQSSKIIALNNMSTLRSIFNRGSGHTRLILILSPT
jgi:hypothetical protein